MQAMPVGASIRLSCKDGSACGGGLRDLPAFYFQVVVVVCGQASHKDLPRMPKTDEITTLTLAIDLLVDVRPTTTCTTCCVSRYRRLTGRICWNPPSRYLIVQRKEGHVHGR